MPDFFNLEISQKVSMTNQLFEWVQKFKDKVSFCQNKHSVVIEYHPLFQNRKLVLSDGKKIPASVKKPSATAAVIFGLGVYPELMQKSIPLKKFDESPLADVVQGVDYESLLAAVDCSYIGSCQTSNDRPSV